MSRQLTTLVLGLAAVLLGGTAHAQPLGKEIVARSDCQSVRLDLRSKRQSYLVVVSFGDQRPLAPARFEGDSLILEGVSEFFVFSGKRGVKGTIERPNAPATARATATGSGSARPGCGIDFERCVPSDCIPLPPDPFAVGRVWGEWLPLPECRDGEDNDHDGKVDQADPDCRDHGSEFPLEAADGER